MNGFPKGPITRAGQTRYPMGGRNTGYHRNVKRLSFWGTENP